MTATLAGRIGRIATGLYRRLKPHVRGRRIPRERDVSLAVPFERPLPEPTSASRIAIVCHLFYPDLAAEMMACAQAVARGADVYVSTDTPGKRTLIEEAFRDYRGGSLTVRLVPNRGRDIAPKLCAFRDVYATYDIVLLLHGKVTPGFGKGAPWRRAMLASLAGRPDTVASILAIFAARADVGMVIAQHYEPIRPFIGWHHNFKQARALAARMGIALTPQHALDLPSGSMFWTRGAALRPLLDLGLTFEDFPVEKGQTNGTPAHAIERLFLFVCEKAGFRWVKVCDPALAGDPSTLHRIGSPADLDTFVETQTKSLLDHRW